MQLVGSDVTKETDTDMHSLSIAGMHTSSCKRGQAMKSWSRKSPGTRLLAIHKNKQTKQKQHQIEIVCTYIK